MNYELIGVDPGGSTGWAQFLNGEISTVGTVMWGENGDDTFDWINEQKPDFWIVEDYIIRPGWASGHAHEFDRGITLQIIGAIKANARKCGATLVLQQPSLKPAAYGQMGQKYIKGKRGMHQMDAIAHATYYINHNLGGFKSG